MAEGTSKVPVNVEEKAAARGVAQHGRRPFESLRREIDHLFEDFDRSFLRQPALRSWLDLEPLLARAAANLEAEPAVDIVENEKAYEITAKLPGMDEKNIEVKLSNGSLTIRGEKQQEREEKRRDYYLHERSFGYLRTRFQPAGRRRCRQDRGELQEGRADGRPSQKARGNQAREKIQVKPAS